jgi:hypothetical protein
MADYAISNVARRVVYTNTGVGPYSFTFEILANTDIAVYRGSTLLTLTTDYSVTINANGTGSITLVTAGTGNITIVGARAIQRTSDYTTGGDLFASTLNTDLDSQTIYAQQVAETAERGLKAPVVDPTDINMTLPAKATRAGTVLAFNATTGNPEAGPSIGSVTTVAAQSANINTVATNIASVNTVAGNNTNINTVAGISGNVTTVAGVSANVTTVAGISANVTTVAGNNANVSTVAGISGNVTTVAGISANVTTVAGINADVSTVATNNANVTTVATNIAAVNTNATNIVAIQNASTNATNAATSATNAANSATAAAASAAAAAASFDAFDDIYLGAKSSNPTVDNDGDPLSTGDQYFNTVSNELRVWNGSSWQAASVIGGTVTSLTVTGSAVANTFSSSGATITGGSINGTTIGATTASTGKFSTLEATGVTTVQAGTVSLPAITTTGDTNTGIYFPAADTIAFTEGGAESMRISSTGTVAIGTTTTPTAKLWVESGRVGLTNAYKLGWHSNPAHADLGNYITGDDGSNYVALGTGGTERMRIDSSGNVGILNSAPATALETGTFGTGLAVGSTSATHNITIVSSTSSTLSALKFGDGGSGVYDQGYLIYDHANNAMLMGTNRAERMRIDSSGNLLVNATSSTGHKMTVQSAAGAGGIDCVGGATNGYYAMRVDMPSTNTYGVLFRNNGNNVGDIRINSSTTTYNTSSDYRLKENIAPMTGALDKVSALKPVTYKWKSTGEESQGFIAHELQAVVPDCVTGEKDAVDEEGNPQYQGIDTSFLVATLTAAIQELKAVVDAQASEIALLKSK